MENRLITADDVIAAGACATGVYEWLQKIPDPKTAYTICEVLALTRCYGGKEYVDFLQFGYGNGYGDGDDYGNGYGYGFGYGFGYGYVNGNGYGKGYGYVIGYGYDNGNCNGYGYNMTTATATAVAVKIAIWNRRDNETIE